MDKVDGVKQKTQRIEYIDAMRGFAMLIVVLHHISLMCLGIDSVFEKWAYEFRMPLFFFISGFVMYKPSQVWTINNIKLFLCSRLVNWILSPSLFFIVYVYVYNRNLLDSIASPAKAGYWFTYVLFTYILIYLIFQYILEKTRLSVKVRDCLLLCLGVFVFFLAYVVSYFYLERNNFWMGLIGGGNLKYFIYFCIGVLSKKYQGYFERMLDTTNYVLICVSTYFLMNIFYIPINEIGPACRLLFIFFSGMTGVLAIFAFFRRNQNYFASSRKMGRILQLFGRRSLEIYFLHYFFIPLQLGDAFSIFREYNLPIIEFVFSLIVSLMVIAVCLTIGAVLRTSPKLGRLLFGAQG